MTDTDGNNDCFRTCSTKTDRNANRDAVNEADHTSSITFVDGDAGLEACVPPS